jgi:hypothetical protein
MKQADERSPSAPAGRLRRLITRVDRRDRLAVGLLLAVPLTVFVLPALLGHPVIAGDNQIQNYPLRVLSGQLLRSGHLPLWNQWIWSGSPLLGGLNAGSFYPGTLAYVVFPGIVAWTVNLVFLYWVAVLGVYALCRTYRLGRLASLLAAGVFGFAGSMTAQMVHLGVVQGAAWIPWMVLGILKLARLFIPGVAEFEGAGPVAVTGSAVGTERGDRGLPGWRQATPWVLLVGVTGGLVILAGEPRSMSDAALVCGICTVWWGIGGARRSLSPSSGAAVRRFGASWFLVSVAAAAVLALALGAAQLLPGIRFLSTTQRSNVGTAFFGFGSLDPRWSALFLVPDLFGGDGVLHQPQYFGAFTLPEVTGYMGLLACVAVVTLLARSIGRKRSPESRTWSVWIVMVVVGLLLCFGTFTPLGDLLSHIPFYGGQRLQSRNLTIVDFGLAMSLAFWVDARRRQRANDRRDLIGLAPAYVAVAICVAVIIDPRRLENAFGIAGTGTAPGLRPWVLLQMVVALAVIVLVVGWPRMSARVARRSLVAVMVVDVVLFSALCSTGFVAGKGVNLLPTASVASQLGSARFAIYDPQVTNLPGLIDVGEADLNALTRHPSVQGYGSAVGKNYDDETDSHFDGQFSPCALEGGVFTAFELRTILATPGSVTQSIAPDVSAGVLPTSATESRACGIDWPSPGATSRSWILEKVTAVDEVDLAVRGLPLIKAATSGGLRVGVVTSGGVVEWPSIDSRIPDSLGVAVRFSQAVDATGIVVRGPNAGLVSDTTIVSGPSSKVTLDGALQDALDRGGWTYSGALAGFGVYKLAFPIQWVWIEGGGVGVSAQRQSVTNEGGEIDLVTADRPVTVERSEAFAKGWTVGTTNLVTGKTQTLRVEAVGLRQGVSLPAGRFRIVWSYWAPGLTNGLLLSGAGSVFIICLGIGWGLGRRRKRFVRR